MSKKKKNRKKKDPGWSLPPEYRKLVQDWADELGITYEELFERAKTNSYIDYQLSLLFM